MQRTLRAMIVEDEPLAARRLIRLLKDFDHVELAAVARDGQEALEIIGATRPNLLLLDIEMPGLNGFELLERLPSSVAPAVILVTAFDGYAVRGFSVRAADFLMKPVRKERLAAALDQAARDLGSRRVEQKLAEVQQLLAELRERAAQHSSAYSHEFWVPHRNEKVRLPAAEIDWIEAEKDYVRIHSGAVSYLLHGLLGAIEQRLDPGEFARVHRSAIVRLDRVRRIRKGRYAAMDLELPSGAVIRVGRKYAADIRRRLTD